MGPREFCHSKTLLFTLPSRLILHLAGHLNQGLGAYSPGTFYAGGCLQDDGSHNCTDSCSSPSSTFANMFTLQNCIVYTLISQYLAADNLTGHDAAGAEEFGIVGDIATRYLISSTTQNCFSGLCSLVNPVGKPCDVSTVTGDVESGTQYQTPPGYKLVEK